MLNVCRITYSYCATRTTPLTKIEEKIDICLVSQPYWCFFIPQIAERRWYSTIFFTITTTIGTLCLTITTPGTKPGILPGSGYDSKAEGHRQFFPGTRSSRIGSEEPLVPAPGTKALNEW